MAETKEEYIARIEAMTDDQFVHEAELKVWLSAFASNNSRAPAHWQCDLCYDEARRREKPWLYQQGWNQACLSAGHQPSQGDIEAAKEPQA